MASRGPPRVDRTKTTPFLVRVFVSTSANHHPDRAFDNVERLSRDEYAIYTWQDCTLRDLVVQVLSTEVGSKMVPLGTARYSLRHVFYDDRLDGFTSKDLGLVFARELGKSAGELRGPPSRTLGESRFIPGDLISLSFMPSASSGPSGSFGGRGPANGDRFSGGPRRRSRSPSPRRGGPW